MVFDKHGLVRGGEIGVDGFFYRVGNSTMPRNLTAADIVQYEIEELGNVESTFPEQGVDLASVPSRSLVWVCATKEDAAYYADTSEWSQEDYAEFGEPEIEIVFLERYRVVATDDQGGYLMQRVVSE